MFFMYNHLGIYSNNVILSFNPKKPGGWGPGGEICPLVRRSPAIFEWDKFLTFKFHEFIHALCGVKNFFVVSRKKKIKNYDPKIFFWDFYDQNLSLKVKIRHHKVGAWAEIGQNRIRGDEGSKNLKKRRTSFMDVPQ